jgi:uncharacterized protein DUF1932
MRLADDLREAGAETRGYDPVRPEGDLVGAVTGADVVLSVNSARAALDAAREALPALAPGAVYADLNTAGPTLKRDLASLVGERFADVALLGPVPARGLGTPALAAGSGAQAFADAVGPLGMPVTVVSDQAGDAAASMQAAEAADCADWLSDEIAALIGRPLLDRLLGGSERHAARRVDEMEAAAELLRELGVEPRIASASASLLSDLAD